MGSPSRGSLCFPWMVQQQDTSKSKTHPTMVNSAPSTRSLSQPRLRFSPDFTSELSGGAGGAAPSRARESGGEAAELKAFGGRAARPLVNLGSRFRPPHCREVPESGATDKLSLLPAADTRLANQSSQRFSFGCGGSLSTGNGVSSVPTGAWRGYCPSTV